MTLQLELPYVTHRNHYLFSDYYLTHRVEERQEWQELDARPHLDALRQLWQARRASLVNANESQTEADWIRPVLRLLGHHFAPQVSLSTPQGVKTPDYILCPDETTRTAVQTLGRPAVEADLAAALAVADAKAWDRPLDRSLPGAGVRTLHQHPGLQIDFYIRHAGLAWGVLTNGRLWQLFHQDTSKKLDVYYEVDLPALLEADDAEAFKYFWLFFRRQAFQPDSAAPDAPAWLEVVLAESASYQQGISESLKDQVYEALQSLAQGFLDFPGNALPADEATLQAIYDHSLLLLYRLLFILYAEDRGLLPVQENTAYRESYSLQALKRRIAQELDAGRPAAPSMSSLWSDLRELWRVIDEGNTQLGVPAYNGGLFKPANHPFLAQYRVGDLHLRAAIDLLARTRDPKTGTREFVDYRDLEIRHLGSIYEGLLEYRVVVDPRPLGFSETPRVSLLTDKGERKATGSYYTPDYIVQYIVEHTVGPALAETAAPYVDVAGATVDPAGLARAVLGVNILDPAMGSGHFLVAAADYVARFLVEKGVVEGKEGKDGQDGHDRNGESQVAYWRRRVAQACIYGVDLNPLAVELAKLSLWLATVSKDKPLSFLDHHLRCGNSLIGARVADLPLGAAPPPKQPSRSRQRQEQQAKDAGQLSMLDDSAFAGSMRTASRFMGDIERLGSETLADVRESERIYLETVRKSTERARLLADLWTARHFGLAIADDLWQGLATYVLHGGFALPGWEELLAQGRQIAAERRFLHWELEFPEVFFDPHGRLRGEAAGFDAVIGNPPWGAELDEPERRYCASSFSMVSTKTKDSYQYFAVMALELLRMKGKMGLITPNTWLLINYARVFRSHMLAHEIITIMDHGDGVFGDATVESTTMIVENGVNVSKRCRAIRLKQSRVVLDQIADVGYWLEDEYLRIVLDVNPENAMIMRKMRLVSKAFKDACTITWGIKPYQVGYGDPPQTREMVDNRVYHSNRNHGLEWKPLLVGTDVDRYSLSFPGDQFIRYGKWLMYPSNEGLMTSPKLLLRQTSSILRASFDDQNFYCQNSVFIIHSHEENLLYLLALLNSLAVNFAYIMGNPQTEKVFPEIKPSVIDQLPIRRIAFTTPTDERQRLAEKGRRLYGQFCAKEDYACVLGFVEQQLAQQPERSDVIHDLLAFLAEQMIELNQQRQKLEQALDPFKFLDRNAACQPLPKVFAAGIKYGELVRSPDPAGFGNPQGLDAVRHDVKGLRLIPLGGRRVELQALLKHRSPVDGWSGWVYEANDKSIVRTWTPVYRFDLEPAEARFYTHALPVLAQFNQAGTFPGGKTKTTMQKLHAVKLPVFDASLDLTPLEELHAELSAVRMQIQRTDRLIDQVVYRLYGLTEEEIAVVEGSV